MSQECSERPFEPLLGRPEGGLLLWSLQKVFKAQRHGARLHCALRHFTLLHSAACMDMHGVTLEDEYAGIRMIVKIDK